MERLDAIPGVNRRTVENVVAEIGPDMSQFPDEDHLSSWAGMSPGNEESAGKRIRNRTTKGNRWLRRALTEAAWAASHTKASYLGAQYRRLAARRGKKRALVAVGHTILTIFYHLLKEGVAYQDLGVDYFDKLKPEQYRRYLVKRWRAWATTWRSRPKSTRRKREEQQPSSARSKGKRLPRSVGAGGPRASTSQMPQVFGAESRRFASRAF